MSPAASDDLEKLADELEKLFLQNVTLLYIEKCLPVKLRHLVSSPRGSRRGPRRLLCPPQMAEDRVCPHPPPKTANNASPSAPTLGELLFNREEQSDVIFLVGPQPQPWRFPAHSCILSRASPVFENILLDKKPHEMPKIIAIHDICPDVFQNILRFIYTGYAVTSSASNAVQTMNAACRYMLQPLVTDCLTYLIEQVTEKNVLEILRLLHPKRDDDLRCESDNLHNDLIIKCYQIVDEHADFVLSMEDFENLDHDAVMSIVSRDSLTVSSEVIVFDAISRWSCQECKRRRLELTSENKREILGKILFAVRYLVMTSEDFHQGPATTGLLLRSEREVIGAVLQGDKKRRLPDHLAGRRLNVKRQNSGDQTTKKDAKRKKSSTSKKVLQGLGDIVIGVIQLLD